MFPPGPEPFCLQFWCYNRLVFLRGLEGTYIYTVELFLGHLAAALFRYPFIFFFWAHWDVRSVWLAPCCNHICPEVQEVLGLPEWNSSGCFPEPLS